MNEFEAYYQIGLRHILDIHAYDHLLFVIVLCAIYQVDEIKKRTYFGYGPLLSVILLLWHWQFWI